MLTIAVTILLSVLVIALVYQEGFDSGVKYGYGKAAEDYRRDDASFPVVDDTD